MSYTGPNTVGQRTVGVVMRLLAKAGKPMSITQLADITGKSYNTVKRALFLGGAVKIDTYPAVFTLPELYEPDRIIGSSAETVQVPYVDHSPAAKRWNEARKKFASNLGAIEITPDADPAKLAEQFTAAATTLASIAYSVCEAKNVPDWYAILGGLTDESH